MLIVIDYKMGNVGSILNMLKKIGVEAKVSSNLSDIENAEKLILPGVGAFDTGMRNLFDMNLLPILNKKVLEDKIPILGICLGMQLMTQRSEEGTKAGLGWFDAKTIRFRFKDMQSNLKIPHMGWNFVTIIKENPLCKNLNEKPRFYFVHSYHVACNNDEDILTITTHGCNFVSSIQKENIFGVQFHPEKSHKFGMKLLKNFAEY